MCRTIQGGEEGIAEIWQGTERAYPVDRWIIKIVLKGPARHFQTSCMRLDVALST